MIRIVRLISQLFPLVSVSFHNTPDLVKLRYAQADFLANRFVIPTEHILLPIILYRIIRYGSNHIINRSLYPKRLINQTPKRFSQYGDNKDSSNATYLSSRKPVNRQRIHCSTPAKYCEYPPIIDFLSE